MIVLVVALIVAFVWAVLATAGWWIARQDIGFSNVSHERELAAIKKVGKWYEGRVEELENESRSLAEQLVAAGAVRAYAMPSQADPNAGAEWAYDATGLVRERLDPRDLPIS